KERPLDRIVYALGIRHVGETTSGDLARWLAGELGPKADLAAALRRLREAATEDYESISGIGPVAARSIHAYFSDPQEHAFLDKLVAAGVRPIMPEATATPAAGPLAGKTVVFTGTLERRSREAAEDLVRLLGGKTSASLSRKTDLVVAGPGAGSKLERAKELGVRVIDEDEFDRMLGRGS
ncbi:MAG: BRCT domain-containing protein, partial [Chloroflexota bacterium]